MRARDHRRSAIPCALTYCGILVFTAALPFHLPLASAQSCEQTSDCNLSQASCLSDLAAEHARFLLEQPTIQDPQLIKALTAQSQPTRKDLCAVEFAIEDKSRATLKSVPSVILEQAVFHKSNLARAVFNGTDLKGASFNGSELKRAVFSEADLTNASFDPWTPASDASIDAIPRAGKAAKQHRGLFCSVDNKRNVNTDLEGAQLKGTILTGAIFSCARMAGALFEPSALPDAASMAYAQSLEFLTYNQDPSPLIRLRQEFRDSGYSTQDRQVTYAIRRRDTELNLADCSFANTYPCLAFLGNKAAQVSCQFGMNLLRPVEIGFFGWLAFALIYFAFMHHPGPSGLYLAVAEGINLDPKAVCNAPQVVRRPVSARKGSWVREEFRLLRVACFFSLINGFNLGFKDFDLGRWLHLLPAQEFEFRALGLPRTIAGIQALFTLAVVALWILILIGHPFD